MRSDLAHIDRARAELAKATTVGQAKSVRGAALLAHELARASGSREAQRYATEIRLRAERRIGELLAAQGEKRGRPRKTDPGAALPEGVSHKQSSAWQRIADMPEPAFEEELAKPEPTTSALLKRAKREMPKEAQRNGKAETCTVADLATLAEQGKTFGTIYADPPWAYGNQGTRAATGNHYVTMSVADICALPVTGLVAENAHCHLWTTNAFLREAFDVLAAWGFTYKSCFVWCKNQIGIGNYWRVSHEFMLLGVKGRAPFNDKSLSSWLATDRLGHSTKPEAVRSLVERASPGPYLELFARKASRGWAAWGNEVKREDMLWDLE